MREKLYIDKLEERIEVAGILIKNGYTVAQGKEKRSPTGKVYDYFLVVSKDDNDRSEVI